MSDSRFDEFEYLRFERDLHYIRGRNIAKTDLIEVPEGHHTLSHHGGDKSMLRKIRRINLFHVEQLAHAVRVRHDSAEDAKDAALFEHVRVSVCV